MSKWLMNHLAPVLTGLVVFTVALGGLAAFLVYDDLKQNDKLKGVEVVGPCRAFGPDHPECKRQSRLIVASCLTHARCLRVINRLMDNLDRIRERPTRSPESPTDTPNAGSGTEGVDSEPSAPEPSEPPSPPNGGRDGDDEEEPPPVPPQPECTVNALGLCVQLPV